MEEFHKVLFKLKGTHHNIAWKHFVKFGLTKGQPKILDYLVLNNGCIQKDIADYCCINPATVTSVLSNMEKSGLICRKQNADNRRILNVFLTEKGFEQQRKVQEVFGQLNELCFNGFTEEEKEETIRLLNKIQNNLDQSLA